MRKTPKTAYLYLAKRDKKGIKLIIRLYSPKELVSRIVDVKFLGLPRDLEKNIEKIVQDNKMDWELWLATVNSYDELKKLLRKRGYSRIPTNSIPQIVEVGNFKNINSNKLPGIPKTMINRGKR